MTVRRGGNRRLPFAIALPLLLAAGQVLAADVTLRVTDDPVSYPILLHGDSWASGLFGSDDLAGTAHPSNSCPPGGCTSANWRSDLGLNAQHLHLTPYVIDIPSLCAACGDAPGCHEATASFRDPARWSCAPLGCAMQRMDELFRANNQFGHLHPSRSHPSADLANSALVRLDDSFQRGQAVLLTLTRGWVEVGQEPHWQAPPAWFPQAEEFRDCAARSAAQQVWSNYVYAIARYLACRFPGQPLLLEIENEPGERNGRNDDSLSFRNAYTYGHALALASDAILDATGSATTWPILGPSVIPCCRDGGRFCRGTGRCPTRVCAAGDFCTIGEYLSVLMDEPAPACAGNGFGPPAGCPGRPLQELYDVFSFHTFAGYDEDCRMEEMGELMRARLPDYKPMANTEWVSFTTPNPDLRAIDLLASVAVAARSGVGGFFVQEVFSGAEGSRPPSATGLLGVTFSDRTGWSNLGMDAFLPYYAYRMAIRGTRWTAPFVSAENIYRVDQMWTAPAPAAPARLEVVARREEASPADPCRYRATTVTVVNDDAVARSIDLEVDDGVARHTLLTRYAIDPALADDAQDVPLGPACLTASPITVAIAPQSALQLHFTCAEVQPIGNNLRLARRPSALHLDWQPGRLDPQQYNVHAAAAPAGVAEPEIATQPIAAQVDGVEWVDLVIPGGDAYFEVWPRDCDGATILP